MSLRSLLMPAISQYLLSRGRVERLRLRAEKARLAGHQRHQVHYFHQVDDPYCALTAAVLPELAARYDIDIVPHLVAPPGDDVAPARDLLVAYSRKDAALLAGHHGLAFTDPGMQPLPGAVQNAQGLLLNAIEVGSFNLLAPEITRQLWAPEGSRTMPQSRTSPEALAAHLQASTALRDKLGHYLGATFFYGGEWYWGIDRLHHLEQRLQSLNAQRPGVHRLMFAPDADLDQPRPASHPGQIDFFFSLRSPYSAIVAPRVFRLGQLTGVPVRLKYVLPMVMRGLPVPANKRRYISLDTAREAHARGIPFGRVNDPLGRPVERGLSIMPYAERAGLGQAYVLSFMRGVWAEGLDAGSDRSLRHMVERAGLHWAEARQAMEDPAWRQTAEAHRAEMVGLGLWGVPSFHVHDTVVWGQDRLWAVQAALFDHT